MKIVTLKVGVFEEMTYILIDERTNKVVIIDPGAEATRIINYLKEIGLVENRQGTSDLLAILITHGHYDHIGAIPELVEKFGPEVIAHEESKIYLNNSGYNLSSKVGREMIELDASRYIKDGEILKFSDELEFKVIYVPGHTLDGVAYYHEKSKSIFVGDIIFKRSIGRSDFFGGNQKQLIAGIKNKIFNLPDNVKIYCGHGDVTTVGEEKSLNPYARI
ncbi:hypothetical protein AN640_04110 [Candidatus Epulonipiscium fishelsonii]|uniref:Uncharacterized protein n=1 Tax=Candidatus Epulonipiscium fishelsonii TaxID=77094 RepID=A0ACC8XIQ3_9FIRM|nr:hypothetical protein AN640_04110 [Epulopiscium sp. SCG-D08WGA-EpuloA1]OON93795.1 MAG: hypothetical protein ATN32_01655 [Epulopiscium sp. AS2M-Bin002]